MNTRWIRRALCAWVIVAAYELTSSPRVAAACGITGFECVSGGPGSGSCTLGSCSKTCSGSSYACCGRFDPGGCNEVDYDYCECEAET